MKYYTLPGYLAQSVYGEGDYGSGLYSAETTGTDSDTDGGLVNTGETILFGTGVALVAIVLTVLVTRRHKQKNKKLIS